MEKYFVMTISLFSMTFSLPDLTFRHFAENVGKYRLFTLLFNFLLVTKKIQIWGQKC